MRSYPVKRPLCAMTVFFIMGLWLCAYVHLRSGWGAFLLPAPLLFATLFVKGPRRAILCALSFAAGFVLLSSVYLPAQGLLPYHGEKAVVDVKITRAPLDSRFLDGEVVAMDGQRLKEATPLRIKKDYKDKQSYATRGIYRFEGELAAPMEQTNPGGYDERSMLAKRGIFTTLTAKSAATLSEAPPRWAQWVSVLREKAFSILDSHLNAGEAALVRATLFGDIGLLSEDFYTASQQFGIIHIFSVSGLHVAFILAFVMGLAKVLKRQNSPWLLLILVPLLTLYTLMCDASAPALRASLMGVLALLAARLLRYHDALTTLALAALCLLVANPFNLFSIGFELSFLAMLGLILFSGAIEAMLHALPKPLASGIAASLAAEMATAPLVTYYFYMLSPLATLMNLLVVPFFSVLVPLSLVAILLTVLLPSLGTLLFLPVRCLIVVIVALMDGVKTSLGIFHIYVGQPSVWLVVALYALALLFFVLYSEKGRYNLLLLSLPFLLLALIALRPAVSSDLRLTVLDVGQGSGAVYQDEDGHWLVFDTGPYKDTVASYLRYSGVNTIEGVVLSHSDLDHIGGLRTLLRDFKVRTIFASSPAQASEAWQDLAPYLKHTEVVTVDDKKTFSLGESRLSLAFLSPESDGADNPNQLTARLDTPAMSVVFPGDVDAPYLDALARPTDIVVVPHHGSKNSYNDDFYTQAQPRLALISAGRDNRFGHPHSEVTEGLQTHAIPYRLTATSGAIMLYHTKDGLTMETYIK